MADLLHSGDGTVRLADAVLRATGGRDVFLRLAASAVPGNDAEQLGLATPEFQDVAIGPVTFRRTNDVKTLLVSASAVKAILGSTAFDSAEVLFKTALGVVIDGVLYEIVKSVASQAMGQVYCFCLTLEPPAR